MDGPGIESRWGGELFRTCPDRPWGPLSLLHHVYRVFPGGKERPGRDTDPTHPSGAVGPVQSLSTCTLYLYFKETFQVAQLVRLNCLGP